MRQLTSSVNQGANFIIHFPANKDHKISEEGGLGWGGGHIYLISLFRVRLTIYSI